MGKHKSRDLGSALVGVMIRDQIRPGIIAEMYDTGMTTEDVLAKFL